MIEPPDELDGARVIKWAWSGDKPFGVIPIANGDSNTCLIGVFGLAICRYDDTATIYRFSCDKDWEVQQDSVYDSIEAALTELPEQYKIVNANWKTK